jgi:hypothetical protein
MNIPTVYSIITYFILKEIWKSNAEKQNMMKEKKSVKIVGNSAKGRKPIRQDTICIINAKKLNHCLRTNYLTFVDTLTKRESMK